MRPGAVGFFVAAACPLSATGLRRAIRKHGANQTFHLRLVNTGHECEVVVDEWGQKHKLAFDGVYQTTPKWEWTDEEEGHSAETYADFFGPEEGMVREAAAKFCGGRILGMKVQSEVIPESTEVRCLACTGSSDNRIDVVLMGDGYQEEERTKFFEDMERLKDEMFADITFRSYLPVFNIWAIHVPSKDSGIGYNSIPKNTPFGLYKMGQQHRAVQPSMNGRSSARSVCRLADGCDFPSLIGNDDFYGGLGGEFTIGTRSKSTGTVVLRHEMGHNFVNVGEEYDGGYVYSGANSDSSEWFTGKPKSNIKWKHWLTEPEKRPVEQKMTQALLTYPWKDMAEGKQSFTFRSKGDMASWQMMFTVSGYPEMNSLNVTLDGQPLDWKPTRSPINERPDGSTVDRQFYHFGDTTKGFAAGTHTLTFESAFPPPAGAPIRQLCSIVIHEFGNDEEFNRSPGYIGAYPSWSLRGGKSFRPTNDQCLMRDMESTILCPVCREGMWLQFLARMDLIDDVEVKASGGNADVQLKAVPLAQLRDRTISGLDEKYTVMWKKGGREQPELQDKFSFSGPSSELRGNWEVTLKYITSEVRKDDRNLLTSTFSFSI